MSVVDFQYDLVMSCTTTVFENQQTFDSSTVPEEEIDVDRKKYKFLTWEFETKLIWKNIFGIFLIHILTVYCLVNHPYTEKPGIVLYSMVVGSVTGFGVTAGAHRYWTHRSYKAKLPLRLILLFCFTLSGQNSILEWVRDHRAHHKYSETDADPHNSRRGFFFAHAGWLMMKKHPEVIRRGRQIDCSDLFQDPLVVFHQRHFTWLKLLCAFIIPTIIPPLTWGESWVVSFKAIAIVRYTLSLNFTWLVNSAAHLWGKRPYDKMICPVENLMVSFFAMGEGYHNYHHTFPWDYKAAEFSRFMNMTTCLLDVFNKIGWAYDMKTTSEELVRKVVENKGDGSHYKWGHEVAEEFEEILKQL